MINNYIPDFYINPILILGCGNILFGDDGFGSQFINYLEKNYDLPDNVSILDCGTGIREILFDVLIGEIKPKKIIIIDAVDAQRTPGEIFDISIDDLPHNKIDDFSMHQMPTLNLLKELYESSSIEIDIIACQVKYIPKMVSSGLSKEVNDSFPKVCEILKQKIGIDLRKK